MSVHLIEAFVFQEITTQKHSTCENSKKITDFPFGEAHYYSTQTHVMLEKDPYYYYGT